MLLEPKLASLWWWNEKIAKQLWEGAHEKSNLANRADYKFRRRLICVPTPARNLYPGWPAPLLCCFEETTFVALSQAAASLKKPLHRLAKLLCKGSGNFSTAFVCICPNCIMYLSRLWNVFVQIVKCTNAGVLIDRCRRDRYHSHFQHGFQWGGHIYGKMGGHIYGTHFYRKYAPPQKFSPKNWQIYVIFLHLKCHFFCDVNKLPNLHDYAKTSPKNSLRKHWENFFRKYAPFFIEGGGIITDLTVHFW